MDLLLRLMTAVLVVVAIIFSHLTNVIADEESADWASRCGVCTCKWVSGKKSADCRKSSLTTIPTLSEDLQMLDLSSNAIPEIRREEFADAKLYNIHKLFMKNCTLMAISKDGLKRLSILIELDMSDNQLKVLPVGLFTEIIKVRIILLNNNEIEVLEDRLFENLNFLHRIELKENRIRKIGLSTFVNLPALAQIHLDSNRLSLLKKETFQNLMKLASLSIRENPWNCTCELQPFRDFAISRNLCTNPTACHDPIHLREKLWIDVPSDSFACRPKIITPRAGTQLDASSENVTLTCRVTGAPQPAVSWLYNKRSLNRHDNRLYIKTSLETNRRDSMENFVSDLTIVGVRSSDKGTYTCMASNRGGKDEKDIILAVPTNLIGTSGASPDGSSNLLLIVCLIAIGLLLLLIIVILVFCCYCRRTKKYAKNGSISENGLVASKIDKSQNDSMLEGGSVIMEMQKSLLTEVNPVEKPPRRADVESNGTAEADDGHEVKKTLLDETAFGSHDDETQSVALSDTTPRSRQTFVDDGYGTNLPPDLLAFPVRFPQSPSLQSSISNIQDGRLYGKSPLSSPVYQHTPVALYPTQLVPSSGFRTLQHPKTGRGLTIAPTSRTQSPFTPGPIIYQPIVMKQGYVTIPRKPRTPSWAPSMSSTATTTTTADFPPTSPTSSEYVEPIYDNLGLRTTAAGSSVLNLNKIGTQSSSKYSMKDRPLPATPSNLTGTLTVGPMIVGKPYDSINDTSLSQLSSGIHPSDTEPLYGRGVNGVDQPRVAKIPPRPPPKPKKKLTVTSAGHQGGSTSQLFEDEGEDGTEV